MEKQIDNKKKYIEKAVAIAAALLVWQIAAMRLNQTILLATPLEVLQTLGVVIFQEGFLRTVGFSFVHIVYGFLIGFGVGIICAIVSARFHVIEILLWPYMAIIKATPVASFIILCLIWLNSRNLSIFICFLIVVPVVYTNLLNGIRSMDPKMDEMARVYQLSTIKKLLAINLPQLRPYILSSFEISIGMAWKAGIAAEVIGIPAGSIGKMLYNAKIYLATPELFAWTVIVVVISVLFEMASVALLKLLFGRLEHMLWNVNSSSKYQEQNDTNSKSSDVVIQNLDFSYENQDVFSDLNMKVAEGEINCIMGASGCGKTTLLKILTRSVVPQNGTITGLDGKRIGMVFQENRLCEDYSAALNVKLGCDTKWKKEQKNVILQQLEMVGLGEVVNRKVSELSGGMKRRVAIVRAMMSNSEILIMDEPLKGLDVETKQMVIQYIIDHIGKRTVLLVTHEESEVEQFGGKLIQL